MRNTTPFWPCAPSSIFGYARLPRHARPRPGVALPYEGYALTAHIWLRNGWFIGQVPEVPGAVVQEASLALALAELTDSVDTLLEVGVMYGLFRS